MNDFIIFGFCGFVTWLNLTAITGVVNDFSIFMGSIYVLFLAIGLGIRFVKRIKNKE